MSAPRHADNINYARQEIDAAIRNLNAVSGAPLKPAALALLQALRADAERLRQRLDQFASLALRGEISPDDSSYHTAPRRAGGGA